MRATLVLETNIERNQSPKPAETWSTGDLRPRPRGEALAEYAAVQNGGGLGQFLTKGGASNPAYPGGWGRFAKPIGSTEHQTWIVTASP